MQGYNENNFSSSHQRLQSIQILNSAEFPLPMKRYMAEEKLNRGYWLMSHPLAELEFCDCFLYETTKGQLRNLDFYDQCEKRYADWYNWHFENKRMYHDWRYNGGVSKAGEERICDNCFGYYFEDPIFLF